MGIFTALLTLPLAPVRGVAWVTEQLIDEAERQLYDEANIRSEMLALELEFDDGNIDELERHEREEALIERLQISRARAAAANEEASDGWQ